ncbi:MAG: hypothetical protein Q4P17_07685 [Methanobacterium sp.]|nr:hypothetical protein [Methanobacterium sp.]
MAELQLPAIFIIQKRGATMSKNEPEGDLFGEFLGSLFFCLIFISFGFVIGFVFSRLV